MTRGRPSFKLDKQRLRSLRKEKGLSLIELSNAISTQNPTWGRGSSEATLTANYQRIEREGRTSRKTAEAIAKALDVSLAFLEGNEIPDSADYLKQIVKLIGELSWHSISTTPQAKLVNPLAVAAAITRRASNGRQITGREPPPRIPR